MKLLSSTNKEQRWEIEQVDRGAIVLLGPAPFTDRKLTNDDVGMVYVAKVGGDVIEWPPIEDETEEDILS